MSRDLRVHPVGGYTILEDISVATDITVLDLAVIFALGRGVHLTYSLRFTSGVTPTNHLVSSMAAKAIYSTYLRPDICQAQMGGLMYHRLTLSGTSSKRIK